MARLWSVETGEVKREYSGHQKALVCLAFRDDVPEWTWTDGQYFLLPMVLQLRRSNSSSNSSSRSSHLNRAQTFNFERWSCVQWSKNGNIQVQSQVCRSCSYPDLCLGSRGLFLWWHSFTVQIWTTGRYHHMWGMVFIASAVLVLQSPQDWAWLDQLTKSPESAGRCQQYKHGLSGYSIQYIMQKCCRVAQVQNVYVFVQCWLLLYILIIMKWINIIWLSKHRSFVS